MRYAPSFQNSFAYISLTVRLHHPKLSRVDYRSLRLGGARGAAMTILLAMSLLSIGISIGFVTADIFNNGL
jgi:hypothetical protein